MKALLFILTFPAFSFLAYDIIFIHTPAYSADYESIESLLWLVFLNDIVAIFCILFFFLFFLRRLRSNRPIIFSAGLSNFIYVILLFLTAALFLFLSFSVFNTINPKVIFEDYSRFYALSKRGTAWAFLIYNAILFLICYDVYRSGLNKTKALIFLLICGIIALTGGRSFLVFIAIFFLYILVVANRYQLKIAMTAVFFGIFSAAFVGNTIMRAGGIENYLASAATKLDFDAAFIFNDVLSHLETNDPEPTLFLEDIANIFIPRSLNPEKPVSTAETRLLYPEVAERGTNITFGIYGNAFLHLGYFGALVPVLYLVGSSFIYIYLTRARKTWLNFSVAMLIVYSMQFVRGGVFNSRLIFVLLGLFVAIFAYELIKIKLWPARSRRTSTGNNLEHGVTELETKQVHEHARAQTCRITDSSSDNAWD